MNVVDRKSLEALDRQLVDALERPVASTTPSAMDGALDRQQVSVARLNQLPMNILDLKSVETDLWIVSRWTEASEHYRPPLRPLEGHTHTTQTTIQCPLYEESFLEDRLELDLRFHVRYGMSICDNVETVAFQAKPDNHLYLV